jgi:hypothetical protein
VFRQFVPSFEAIICFCFKWVLPVCLQSWRNLLQLSLVFYLDQFSQCMTSFEAIYWVFPIPLFQVISSSLFTTSIFSSDQFSQVVTSFETIFGNCSPISSALLTNFFATVAVRGKLATRVNCFTAFGCSRWKNKILNFWI